MATTVSSAGQPAAAEATTLTWLTEWIKGHRQVVTYAGVLLALAAGLFAWNLLTTKTAERNAGSQLEQGRLALDSRNYPLAASVLAQVVENYSGTHAAQEGASLLAQVRLARRHTPCWARRTKTRSSPRTRASRTSKRRRRPSIRFCEPSSWPTRDGRGS